METQWERKLVNLHQSPKERRLKYHLVQQLGGSWQDGRCMRDWRWNKIARRFGYEDFAHLERLLNKEEV